MKVRRCDQEFTVTISGNKSAANENLMKKKTLENCFNKGNDREMGNIVDTVDNSNQNTNLTANDSIIALKIKLGGRSINAVSWRNQNVGIIWGLLPLLEMYSKANIHYMCLQRMMRVEIIFRTR